MFVVLLIVFPLVVCVLDWYRKKYMGRLSKKIPSPPNVLPLLGHAAKLADTTKMHSSLHDLAMKYQSQDGLMKIWLMGEECLIISKPSAALTKLLNSKRDRGEMARNKEIIAVASGLTSMAANSKHKKLRKLWHPFANTFKFQPKLTPILHKHGARLVDYLNRVADEGTVVDMQRVVSLSMYDTMAELVYGLDLNTLNGGSATEIEAWEVMNEWVFKKFMAPVLQYFPRSADRAAVKLIFNNARQAIKQCRERRQQLGPDAEPTSIMDYYFQQQLQAAGAGVDPDLQLSEDEQVSHGVNWFWGAVDSTRHALCVSMAYAAMAENKQHLHRVRRELDQVLGGSRFPTSDELQSRLPETGAWTTELLRVAPAFPSVFWYTTQDLVVDRGDQQDQLVIPAKTFVWHNTYSIARDPEGWGPDADQFNPQRFIERQRETDTQHPWFMSFGGGTRKCPGERLGLFDVRMLSAIVLPLFDFELVNDHFELELTLSLRMKNGLPMRVKKRQQMAL